MASLLMEAIHTNCKIMYAMIDSTVYCFMINHCLLQALCQREDMEERITTLERR